MDTAHATTGTVDGQRASPGQTAIAIDSEVVGIALGDKLAEMLNVALERVAVHLTLLDAREASAAALDGAKVILVGQGLAEARHELVVSIRQSAPAAALLLVAEPGDDFATVLGLELGADAFVRADEGCRVLMSQVRAMLRQSARWRAGLEHERSRQIQVGRAVLQYDACSIFIEGECHTLPLVQFAVLWTLAQQNGRVVHRKELADLISDVSGHRYARQVDTVVCRLRDQLEVMRSGLRIRTVRGAGYMLSAYP